MSGPPGRRSSLVAARPVRWRDGTVLILDQRRLPAEERYVEAREPQEVAEAIRAMAVRGAPLIGIAAAYGVALAALRSRARSRAALLEDVEAAGRLLAGARPTAVNLSWAVGRVVGAVRAALPVGLEAMRGAAVAEARAIAREDEEACLAIARLGAELVPAGARILTHCNTGSLATGGCGTAQGVILAAHREGKVAHVWVDETRPLLQGARLTAWELRRLGVPMTLVADTAAGSLMARGLVDLVVVGADRVAANGDVANKVGTYQLAVLARHHRIPFLVAAPVSTLDPATPRGDAIVIEERDPGEVLAPLGVRFAPEGAAAANPAFDVTPARLVTAIVTDRGVAGPPYRSSLRALLEGRAGGATGWPGAAGQGAGAAAAGPGAAAGPPSERAATAEVGR
ncbi:MAG TPA: S-methyl-5-thioribose-1-phosphate isomerase [Actinomycetota bacterium]|nr:S-methyl-5-thioribose-1-phosphate isomerase [Actinomycetota bacterium]